jgi:hypothetical protein
MNKPTHKAPDLTFLTQAPLPLQPGDEPFEVNPDDLLPQHVADELLKISSVVGAWIERDAQGKRFVAVHCDRAGRPAALPVSAHGLPIRIVGHAPIRAG